MASLALSSILRRGPLTFCRLVTTAQYLKDPLPRNEHKQHGVAQFHTCNPLYAEEKKSLFGMFKKDKTQQQSVVPQDNLFEDAYKKSPNRESFEHAIKSFEDRDIRRRGHVGFIYVALKWMKVFGVEKDIKVYNRLLHVFPKGEFIPENFVQTMFQHFPEQQICAIKVLQQMEDNGIMPDEETKGVLLAVFGRKGNPVRKLQRILYWFYKFRHVNPFPVPKVLPEDPVEVARLGLKRIAEYEAKFDVFKYTNGSGEENFIAQVQSPEQKELLADHPRYAPVYVEGTYNLWLRNKKMTYFVLRADHFTLAPSEEEENEKDKKREVVPVHKEGPVFAMCATSDNSQESLRTWINNLQEENPNLGNIPVVFNIYQPPPPTQLATQTGS
ncbi:evolutionarily conserved signaling intermediate in Toll pathway, mitochondrial-like [Glandiceps talaboti]